MATPVFWTEPPVLQADGTLVAVGSAASTLEQAFVQFFQSTGNGVKTLKFLAKGNLLSQAVVETVDVTINGNDVHIGSAIVDITSTASITAAIAVVLGVSAGWPMVAVAAAGSVIYSTTLEPIVDDYFATLAGKTELVVHDANGNILAGATYPEGLPPTIGEAIRAVASHAATHAVDIEGLQITVNGTAHDGSVYNIQATQDILGRIDATQGNVSWQDVMDAGPNQSSLTNADHYVEHNGEGFIILNANGTDRIYVPFAHNGTTTDLQVYGVFGNGEIASGNLLLGRATGSAPGDHAMVMAGSGGGTITGSDQNDILLGSNEDDIFIATEGDDKIIGGDGVDLLDFEQFGATYSSGSVNVNLETGVAAVDNGLFSWTTQFSGIDDVKGTGNSDVIQGNASNNVLAGAGGDDVLRGGAGFDTYLFRDGNGTDTVIDANKSGVIQWESAAGQGAAMSTFGKGDPKPTDPPIESTPTLTGLAEYQADSDSWILNSGGQEFVLELNGRDLHITKTGGTVGDKIILGGFVDEGTLVHENTFGKLSLEVPGSEIINGDWIPAIEWDNAIYGTSGSDNLTWQSPKTRLNDSPDTIGNLIFYGDSGDDNITGGDQSALIYGGAGHDVLYGSMESYNIIYGGQGNDEIRGGFASDFLSGGAGDDFIRGGSGGHDYLTGGSGNDTLSAGFSQHGATMAGGIGDDFISGGESGGDLFVYNMGDGNDTIVENGGNDTLQFGAGIALGDLSLSLVDVTSLRIEIAGGGSVFIQDYFSSFDSRAVETIAFDGGVLVSADVYALTHNKSVTGTGLDDTFAGGLGNDTIDGSGGNDTVSYASLTSRGVTVVLDSTGSGTASQGENTDTLINIEHIIGSDRNDSLRAMGAGITLNGAAGDDTLEGGGDGDTLIGAEGYDLLSYEHAQTGVQISITGEDTVIGGFTGTAIRSGESTADSFNGIEAIAGTAYADVISFASAVVGGIALDSGDGNDSISGSAGSDALTGSSGNDTLNGGSGNDILIGGLGADVLKGEGGADVYRISSKSHSTAASTDMVLGFSQVSGDKIDLSNLGFSDLVAGQANAEGTTLAYWTQFGDTFVGNADGSFRLRIDGEFTLTRGDFIGVGPDYAFTHLGTAGADSLVGSTGDDAFNGGKGQDVLRGKGGSDIYFYDHLEDSKGTSPDTILEWDNSDIIDVSFLGFTGLQEGTANGSTLGWAVVGNYTEIFDSGKFLIRIHNGTAIETPELSWGNFIFNYGEGFSDETYSGTSSADTYTTGLGNDVLNGNDGDDMLTGGGGHDTLDGGAGNDTLFGGDGDDTLFGQGGYDRLEAGAGHDRLIAGVNKDWLVGGSGNDTFSFFSDSHSSEIQPDTIADFVQGEDIIDIGALTYTGIQSGSASGTVLGFTYQQNSSSQNITVIEADTGTFEIIIMGHVNLTNADFAF